MKTILITGGAGFIGSHVCRHFVYKYPDYRIINFDVLTYAGNLENLKDVETQSNYTFVQGDITDFNFVMETFRTFNVTDIIHLAAETHVDRSIVNPIEFVTTNVIGTVNLLNAAKDFWKDDYLIHRFHHVSTDEVYGSLNFNDKELFKETNKYDPHSPYSASKASSDLFVKSYHDTYGMNITISNCSNNYGPNQFPEKLIPLVINNLSEKRPIPVYGNGDNIRDWLFVEDHADAIDIIFHQGKNGETYNIGGNCEKTNLEIIDSIIKAFVELNFEDLNSPKDDLIENYRKTIKFIEDRKGHDKRYAIDCSKIKEELGWIPSKKFNDGIKETVNWYMKNKKWLDNVTSGKYKIYYKNQYKI